MIVIQGGAQSRCGRRRRAEPRRASVDVKAVGEAAAGIAHELNNRLSVILGQAQLLRRSAGADATVDRKLQTIEREVQRASAMTRGLLERARTEPRQEPVAVNTVVACALDAVEPRLSELAIAVETDLSDEQPVVLGDLERLIQVLLHLVNNAVDAMGESGTLTVTTELTDDAVTLAVADTGAGMEAEQATRIFEPFYTTKANGRGAGLGLFLTLGILKTHGGSISVESTPGHGTTMRVRLPRSDAPTLGVIR